jgi:hypothetical protein
MLPPLRLQLAHQRQRLRVAALGRRRRPGAIAKPKFLGDRVRPLEDEFDVRFRSLFSLISLFCLDLFWTHHAIFYVFPIGLSRISTVVLLAASERARGQSRLLQLLLSVLRYLGRLSPLIALEVLVGRRLIEQTSCSPHLDQPLYLQKLSFLLRLG